MSVERVNFMPTNLIPPMPAGFEWCGSCGCSNRPLTEGDARALLEWALSSVREGASAHEVLTSLWWPIEQVMVGYCVHTDDPHHLAAVPDRGYFVYRLYDADDRLLYVGMSRRVRSRLREHYASRGGYVDHHNLTECANEAEMVALERLWIQSMHPPLNDVDNGERSWPG